MDRFVVSLMVITLSADFSPLLRSFQMLSLPGLCRLRGGVPVLGTPQAEPASASY